ncbi:TldD/PmbA family protein [Microcoleus sp. FACHB-1515]|uniref:TldD/PmbA family protein n=1 Tax=Cyanophyceae TaxID=3028117 RepID=UPI0016859EB4|nr:metallopeptidase TldD-related protein [Microcoleus sp. FACHB-1515]MBD2092090.1 TldD/PmbA family protein [Microcoleus sp. FACHB-1515]
MKIEQTEAAFTQVVEALRSHLQPDEAFTLELWGEQSQFVRFNQAKVRQTGTVIDGQMQITLMQNQRSSYREVPFTGEAAIDLPQALRAIEELRSILPQLPIDPYLVLPAGSATSRDSHQGDLLAIDAVADAILPAVSGLDFTGLYAGGLVLRAYADSAGQRHWFATDSFAIDYSIFTTDGQAVKGTYAGSAWNQTDYSAKLDQAKLQLERLAQPPKAIPKGQYRTYLAPAAMAELIAMFSWGAVSEAALQQGNSALASLQRGEKRFSPLFTLKENFDRGLVPRFNDLGEVAPIDLPLIENGQLVNTLVSSRTAKEYGKTANGADGGEYLRSPEVAPGKLAADDVLKTLDTGLFLSNLHYLNWSDRPTARVTGMTRYACFWVANGEIVAPIENLRFDESLYRCFGENLVALTDFQEFIPEVGSYDRRSLGGTWTPGAIADDFTYTL